MMPCHIYPNRVSRLWSQDNKVFWSVLQGCECFNDGLSLNSRGSWPDIQHSVSCIYSVIPCMLSWTPWNLWPIKRGFVLYRCFYLLLGEVFCRSLYFLQGLLSHLVDVDLSSRPHKTRCVLSCWRYSDSVFGHFFFVFSMNKICLSMETFICLKLAVFLSLSQYVN